LVKHLNMKKIGIMSSPTELYSKPPIPISMEFYNKIRNEYDDFYSPKIPMAPLNNDDGYDAFYKYKRSTLPKQQESLGPGWIVKNEDMETFFPSQKGAPMPKKIQSKLGTKEFIENYQKPSENSLLPLYSNIIRSLIEDDLKSKYLPIIY